MSGTKCSSRAWTVAAASVGAVEALKDQLGFCRWNHAIRSVHNNAKSNVTRSSIGQAKTKLQNDVGPSDKRLGESEESLRTVIYLSCWGPNN
ncbi:Wound-responsive family protein [Striga hermonthica]|uniref:Wound-responsive family protein n=1 Tax=Striga hermonthica TaxID=68872 RepID=A0A9N7MYR1_STRHE|nr:Wound-responsive family protein [Striga hermonthica]